MNSRPYSQRWLSGLLLAAGWIIAQLPGFAAPTNVFFTQFEAGEGYNTTADLVGQNNWTSQGTGGNGVVTNFIVGQGQQAYIGYSPPDPGDEIFFVWRPINFKPIAAGLPLVRFSVLMSIRDSENNNYDYFRWSVYNEQASRLFSIEFDNYFTNVNYELDGNNQVVTNVASFTPNSNYVLTVTMNFAANRWSATLDSALIATNQPLTTTGLPLTLGDIDAVWWLFDTNAPGDNYMLFDNYRITAEALTGPPVPPAQVQFLGRTSEGWALLRVSGQNGSRWSLDATTNFINWTALKTNTVSGGYYDQVDTTAAPFARRFYRARLVP